MGGVVSLSIIIAYNDLMRQTSTKLHPLGPRIFVHLFVRVYPNNPYHIMRELVGMHKTINVGSCGPSNVESGSTYCQCRLYSSLLLKP